MKHLLFFLLAYNAVHGQEQNIPLGPALAGGGISLTLAAAFTPTEFDRRHGGPGWQQTPLHKQSARFAGIVAGSAITLTGGITALTTRDKRKRKKR